MGRLIFSPCTVKLTTDITGVANLSLKIPGTFTGATGDTTHDGRFFKGVNLWSAAGTHGDRIYDFSIEDTDGVFSEHGIPTVPFPDYPVLTYFQDQEIVETASLLKGSFLRPEYLASIASIDAKSDEFSFIPAGLYIKGKFKTANIVKIGQVVYCNIIWGKWSNI